MKLSISNVNTPLDEIAFQALAASNPIHSPTKSEVEHLATTLKTNPNLVVNKGDHLEVTIPDGLIDTVLGRVSSSLDRVALSLEGPVVVEWGKETTSLVAPDMPAELDLSVLSEEPQPMKIFDIRRHNSPGPSSNPPTSSGPTSILVAPPTGSESPPGAPPNSRSVHGLETKQEMKGVKQLKLEDGKLGWYKPSNRQLNNPQKCLGMGIIKESQVEGATEATARLPEREVAASLIAHVLIPHMAVGAELAHTNDSHGVLLSHVSGDMAISFVNYESVPFELGKEVYQAVASQLSDLQAFDYLIGNVDRHLENFMIDGSTVRAIDNDLSFPTVSVDKLSGVPESKFGEFPTGYSKALKENLAKLTDEFLTGEIKPLIGDEAFAQLQDRLNRLRTDVASKPDAPAEPSSPHLKGIVLS